MDRWLAAALDYLPRWLDHQMRLTEQPGCAIAVAHRGKLVLEAAFGHADLARGEALTPRHRFRVASHSKSFTAAGVLKLREQGRAAARRPGRPLRDGLHPQVAAATLAQLLSHSAGLVRDGADAGQWADRRPFLDAAGAARRPGRRPGDRPEHARFKYSNHGYAPRRASRSRRSPASRTPTGSRARSSPRPACARRRPTRRSTPACRSRAATAPSGRSAAAW